MIVLEHSAALVSLVDTKTKQIKIQPDRYGDENGGPAVDCVLPFGIWCRPRDPDMDPNGLLKVGSGVLYGSDGDEEFVLPVADPRYVVKLPDPGKGGLVLYSTVLVGTFLDVSTVWLKPDGSLATRSPYSSGTKAHSITVSAGADGALRLTHGEGMLVEVSKDHVELGGTGGSGVVYDSGALTTFFNAVAAATGVAAPSGFKSSKVRVVA
jgi:hypothetical protein